MLQGNALLRFKCYKGIAFALSCCYKCLVLCRPSTTCKCRHLLCHASGTFCVGPYGSALAGGGGDANAFCTRAGSSAHMRDVAHMRATVRAHLRAYAGRCGAMRTHRSLTTALVIAGGVMEHSTKISPCLALLTSATATPAEGRSACDHGLCRHAQVRRALASTTAEAIHCRWHPGLEGQGVPHTAAAMLATSFASGYSTHHAAWRHAAVHCTVACTFSCRTFARPSPLPDGSSTSPARTGPWTNTGTRPAKQFNFCHELRSSQLCRCFVVLVPWQAHRSMQPLPRSFPCAGLCCLQPRPCR